MSEQAFPDGSKGPDLSRVAGIVAAFVSNNALPQGDLPGFIAMVHRAFGQLVDGLGLSATPSSAKEPAVPIKKSVTKEFIICLEDGRKFKTLKRHLGINYNLTPDQYKQKWGLPCDYPMVAPAYAAIRSSLAKEAGLGSKRKISSIKAHTKRKSASKNEPASNAA